MRWVMAMLAAMGVSAGCFAQEIPATKVSLSLKDVLVEEVCQRITEASGVLTMTKPAETEKPAGIPRLNVNEAPRMDFEARDEAYWSVIRRFCEARGMTVVQPPEEYRNAVYLMPGNATGKMPTSMIGGSMFQIKGGKTSLRQDFTGAPPRTVSFEMLMYSEPKAGIIRGGSGADGGAGAGRQWQIDGDQERG